MSLGQQNLLFIPLRLVVNSYKLQTGVLLCVSENRQTNEQVHTRHNSEDPSHRPLSLPGKLMRFLFEGTFDNGALS